MRTLLSLAVLTLVSGCGVPKSNPEPVEQSISVEPNDGIGAEAGPPNAWDSGGNPEFGIPPALQGRWGLVAADCEPDKPDTQGSLVVSATTLTFYESVAKLSDVAEVEEKSVRATFDFAGEGENWRRVIQLSAADRRDAERVLTRREFGEGASEETFTYIHCQ